MQQGGMTKPATEGQYSTSQLWGDVGAKKTGGNNGIAAAKEYWL